MTALPGLFSPKPSPPEPEVYACAHPGCRVTTGILYGFGFGSTRRWFCEEHRAAGKTGTGGGR